MDFKRLADMLQKVQDGSVSIAEVCAQLKKLPFEDLGFAKIDHHRSLRHGFPEVVWGEGKTMEQIAAIIGQIDKSENTVLATRINAETGGKLALQFGHGKYLPESRLFVIEKERIRRECKGVVIVISAGTADMPVAEEAYWTAHYMGNEVSKIYDAGVSGIHRLLSHTEMIQKASVVIVVAGMEGALVPVVAGIAGVPVIGVPTSVGYGASLSGLTPLFAMLSSCASGVTVVNIDNGFGAAYAATLMNRL